MILNLSIIQKKFLDCLLVNSVVNESEIVKISKIELDTIFADYGNIDSIIYNHGKDPDGIILLHVEFNSIRFFAIIINYRINNFFVFMYTVKCKDTLRNR